ADLFDEDAVLVEFPQTRVCTAEIDEDVSLRICCDTDSFAESFTRRRLQKIRHRRVGDLRYVLNCGFLLRRSEARTPHESDGKHQCETRFHGILRVLRDSISIETGTVVRAIDEYRGSLMALLLSQNSYSLHRPTAVDRPERFT